MEESAINALLNKNNELMFSLVVEKILKQHYSIESQFKSKSLQQMNRFDFLTSNGVNIEVKFSNQDNIFNLAQHFRNFAAHCSVDMFEKTIFITNIAYKDTFVSPFTNKFGENLNIISLENLLYLCKDNEKLKSELLSFIKHSTEDITPLPLDKNIEVLLSGCKVIQTESPKPISFKEKLESIKPGKKDFKKFEDFCEEFVNTIFQDNIENVIPQRRGNKYLFRYDLISSIKEDPKSFWKFIYEKYNSWFILFECKNYNEKITQEQIYLTERYLYSTTLRNVAIILTRKGLDKNALLATQDILKEHGKLILVLDDNDIVELSNIYEDYKTEKITYSPSSYLLAKAKDFLLNIDK